MFLFLYVPMYLTFFVYFSSGKTGFFGYVNDVH